MKLLLATCAICISLSSAFAIPQVINYQGQLTSPSGAPLDTTVAILFNLWTAPSGGSSTWTELHPAVTVTGGLFNVQLGSSVPIPEMFSVNRWLGVNIGADAEMTPREQVVSVGHAYRVATLDGASGGSVSGKLNAGAGNSNAGTYAMVFGQNNQARGNFSVVAGGGGPLAPDSNSASGHYSAISGGSRNRSSGLGSAVGGGTFNRAQGDYSVVAGGGGSTASDSNWAGGIQCTISGGGANRASASGCVIGGGAVNAVDGAYGTVGGGYWNASSGAGSTIGGGTYCSASGDYSAIGGGNYGQASGAYSTVGGGKDNRARGDFSVVAGGGGFFAEDSNRASGYQSAVGGGRGNSASGWGSVVTGGRDNIASGEGGSVGGGALNAASAYSSTVAGGYNNDAGGDYSTVGGGYLNNATGDYSAIAGGSGNTVSGEQSFACGSLVNCLSSHAFAFGDGSEIFSPGANNTASFLTTGGFRIWTGSPVSSNIGTRLAAGGTSWIALCDSTTKENRRNANGADVLEKLSAMPIDRWNYKHQDDNVEHVGPMAQDFWNAFHLGSDSLGIETLDADGVLFASVKELAKQNGEKDEKIANLEARVKQLEAAILQSGMLNKEDKQ